MLCFFIHLFLFFENWSSKIKASAYNWLLTLFLVFVYLNRWSTRNYWWTQTLRTRTVVSQYTLKLSSRLTLNLSQTNKLSIDIYKESDIWTYCLPLAHHDGINFCFFLTVTALLSTIYHISYTQQDSLQFCDNAFYYFTFLQCSTSSVQWVSKWAREQERERAKENDKTVYMDLKQWVNCLCVHFRF